MKYSKLILALSILSLSPYGTSLQAKGERLLEVQLKPSVCTGLILDKDGTPIIGASIVKKGTTIGITSDLDGKFILKDVAKGDILVVSYIGYKSKEVVYQGKALRITLQEENEVLSDLIVVGYGSVKKADLAGSVSVLSNKAFKAQPVTKISDAIQGRVSGVLVQNAGGPGGAVKIRVRGAGSINRSNDPLYIVDGIVREGGISDLNTEDIKSMQVLKDASSTAIYGSRGSNGVVMITTKSGVAGQRQIIFDSQVGFSNVAKRFDLLSASEFAEAYNESKANTFSAQDIADFKAGIKGTDWQDRLFQTGLTQNYKLVLSNGTKRTQYYISGNYISDKGLVIKTKQERYQFRSSISSEVSPFLHLKASVDLSHSTGRNGDFSASKGNLIMRMLNFSPVTNVMGKDNYYANDLYSALLAENPVGTMEKNDAEARRNALNAHIDLKFKLAKGLSFTTSNGVDYIDSKNYHFNSKFARRNKTSDMGNSAIEMRTLQTTNNLTYQGNWDKHSLTATAVFEGTNYESRMLGISANHIAPESVGWWNVGLGKSPQGRNHYSSWTLLSGVSRLMYNYDNRYLITATMRADGSSKFSGDKWGYFPSLAVAWQMRNEEFFKKQDIFQDAKLRVSYGVVGSQAISPYGTLGLMQGTKYSFDTGKQYAGYWAGTNVPLPDLTWEKTKQYDLGLEFSILNHRLNFSFDYFVKNTTDGLLKKSLPKYDGGGSNWINAGEISNRGLDMSINARIIEGKDLSWTSTLTGTYLKNRVESLAGMPFVAGSSPAKGMIPDDGVTRVVEGESLGTFYLYEWTGLDKNGKDTYADINKDGKIDSDDRVLTGKAIPTFTLGWNNSFTYKNWSLNMFFTGAFGADRLNLVRFTGASINGDSNFITLREAWTNSFGRSSNPRYPSPSVKGNKYEAASTKWLESADYLRLDNLSLSYDLKKAYTKFADIRLSLSCQNLFTISSYKGMDPAGVSMFDPNSGSSDINDGIDIGAYPLPRIVTFGLRFNF